MIGVTRIGGGLWIIDNPSRIATIARWMDDNLATSIHELHRMGFALMVDFASDDDEVMFRLMFAV